MAAAVANGLRLGTSQVEFTARPALRSVPSGGKLAPLHSSADSSRSSRKATPNNGSAATSASSLVANPKLSIIEVEALLREKVRSNYGDLVQGFKNYDRDHSQSVTKGEFRRVLEAFCLHLTTDQFENIMNKVQTNPNGTIKYNDFLDKFYGKDRPKKSNPKQQRSVDQWINNNQTKFIRPQSPVEMNTDFTEKQIREQVHQNLKNVIKALRLYDYNRDGHVQKHELRKVLENYCFKMTDQQYDKLYQRYDFHHRGVINYKDFLMRLGINIDKLGRPAGDGSQNNNPGLSWPSQPPLPPPVRPGLKHPDDAAIKGLGIHQVEVEFRNRMVANYANLKRMFLALDRHLDGFVSLEDLKSVLNQFTFAMSDQLFKQLMDRFGIKASGKISWEFFLEKFQDPQGHGNGQTIPMKPNHKFFPIRGADESRGMSEIVQLLDNHVKNAYSSFKHAFLQMDTKRDGCITRKDLKKVMEGFKFRIKDEQFKELFDILDPEHSNSISYHKFLALFEPYESLQGHKWLQSCHRYNDPHKPTVMAWKTVEEILRDRIEDHWKDVSAALVKCDPAGTGRIYPSELRRILARECLPVSDEHFDSLLTRVRTSEDEDDGRVGFVPFLLSLGVTISPGDIAGFSTRIHQQSLETEAKHRDDQQAKQEQSVERALGRTSDMTVDEVLVRIKDRMAQHKRSMLDSFKMYDRKSRGKLTKKEFRAVLETHGIYMTTEQFRELCSRLQFHGASMSYMDFVTNFEDLRMHNGGDLNKINNHKVNPHRGCEYGLTAEEAEHKLKTKLRENFEDLRGAFVKFDANHRGELTKSAFRRMLDAFMVPMDDAEFNKLCASLGVNNKSRITYKDFLSKFEVTDSEEGHHWVSDHKYNDVKEMSLMSADAVHEVLATKAHRSYADIARAFGTMDYSRTGTISKQDLREVLYKFMLPISKPEFTKLWAKYDSSGMGCITHQDFLQRLTAGDKFAPGDREGQSKDIIEGSYNWLAKHHADQLSKQEQQTENQAEVSMTLTVDQVLQQLKDRIREQYKDFTDAFKKYDKKQKGFLSVADVQRVLVDFNYFLDDDQFFDLLDRLGLSTSKSRLSYGDFLRAFEEGRADSYAPRPADVGLPRRDHDHLTPDQAADKLRQRVAAQLDTIRAALQAFDRTSCGYISIADFRRVLDNFCFRMSDPQFAAVTAKLPVNTDGSLDYSRFLEQFIEADPEADPRKWVDMIQKRLDDEGPRNMTMDEVHDTLKELVTARFYNVANAFAEVDYAKIGVVSKDDFRKVLNETLLRLSDEQFDRLWSVLRVNEFGNLEYQDFLDHYTGTASSSSNNQRRPISTAGSRPGTRLGTSGGFRRLHTSSGRPITPLVNAESAEERVRERVSRHWRDLQKQCRGLDPANSGAVGREEFRALLSRYNLSDLSHDDIFKLLLKYDLHNDGRFCYREFLRHLILNVGGGGAGGRGSCMETGRASTAGEGGRASRMRSGGGGRPLGNVSEHPANMEDALDRVRVCVSDAWKDMRKQLRQIDPSATGHISVDDFRDVLRQNNINLAEDEFSYIVSLYCRGSQQVNYNDFIKDFLKSS